MAKFRKKPVVIDAWQLLDLDTMEGVCHMMQLQGARCSVQVGDPAPYMRVATLEGVMEARHGDYIIKGVNGEFYPCKPDIFAKTYDPAEE